MEKEIKVTCPGCDTILIVDRISGAILETRKALVDKSSGDRFTDAFSKLDEDKKRREGALDNLSGKLEQKKKIAEELFKASLDDAKDDESRPENIFDRD